MIRKTRDVSVQAFLFCPEVIDRAENRAGSGKETMSKNGFYDSRAWRRVRREVMAMDHNECQICRRQHKHTPGVIVHHSCHLDEYPELGLMVWVEDPVTGQRQRNLITVCRECHRTVCHPERMEALAKWKDRMAERKEPLTPERW